MENSPNLLSLGTMVMKEGYSLTWPAFGRPSLKDPKGQPVEVVMRGTVPTLRSAAASTVTSEGPEQEGFLDVLAHGGEEQVHQALEELFDGFFESQEFKDVALPVTEPEPETLERASGCTHSRTHLVEQLELCAPLRPTCASTHV